MKSTCRLHGRTRKASCPAASISDKWRFSIPDVPPPGVICVNRVKYYPGKARSTESNGIRCEFKREKRKLTIHTREDIRMIELAGKVIELSGAKDARGTKYPISHFEEVDTLVGQNMSKWKAIQQVALNRGHDADSFGRAWRRYKKRGR